MRMIDTHDESSIPLKPLRKDDLASWQEGTTGGRTPVGRDNGLPGRAREDLLDSRGRRQDEGGPRRRSGTPERVGLVLAPERVTAARVLRGLGDELRAGSVCRAGMGSRHVPLRPAAFQPRRKSGSTPVLHGPPHVTGAGSNRPRGRAFSSGISSTRPRPRWAPRISRSPLEPSARITTRKYA